MDLFLPIQLLIHFQHRNTLCMMDCLDRLRLRKRKSELINQWLFVYFPDCSLLSSHQTSGAGRAEAEAVKQMEPENSDYLFNHRNLFRFK